MTRTDVASSSAATRHHFTVDLEEYFHVSALEPWVARSTWPRLESRVERSTCELLELLDEARARATFFVLGWLAHRQRQLVRRIAQSGHEIASHGWEHRRVTQLAPKSFRASVRRSKALLQDLTGAEVVGYRAPSFSIVPGREWALDVLIEEGYRYDSSLFPVRRPGYGYPGASPVPHCVRRAGGVLVEFPPATLHTPLCRIPAGGGAYLRFFPVSLIAAALRELEEAGASGTIYVHPWELDPEQPRFAVSWPTRVRHYTGLRGTAGKLRALLAAFRFVPLRDTLASVRASGGSERRRAATAPRRAPVSARAPVWRPTARAVP